MTRPGTFTFTLEDESGFGIEMRVPEGETISEMLMHFESFLMACGYRLGEEEHLMIEKPIKTPFDDLKDEPDLYSLHDDLGNGSKYIFSPEHHPV